MNKITTIRLQFWLPLSIFIAFTLLLLLFSILQYLGFRRNLEDRTVVLLQERITQVGNRLERLYNNNLENLISFELADLNISNEVQTIALIDEQGVVLNASQVEWKGQPVGKCIPAFIETIFRFTQSNNRQKIQLSADGDHIYVYEPILLTTRAGEIRPTRIGLLYVDYNLSQIKSKQRQSILVQTYFIWGLGLLLMVLFYFALRFWLTKPYRHLQFIINQFGTGNYSARINIKGKGELAEVANSFNSMAEEVSTQRESLQAVLETKIQIEKELLIAKQKAEESDKLKSSFLANMSHEIRTPMNGILGFTDLLKDKTLTDDERDKFIDIIHNSSRQLMSIINDLIDISKIEAGQETLNYEVFNLNQLVDELYSFFQPLAENRNLKLSLRKPFPNEESFIRCDSVKLRQVLINLLGNALKFTHAGSIKFGYNLERPNLVFQVEDTGIGVGPPLQKVIFDRFRQASITPSLKYSGTGLGLAISKSYIEMMGGNIWVESQAGSGSRFIFTIPFDSVSPESKNSKSPSEGKFPSMPDWLKNTIMVVEDIEDNALLIRQALKSTGISVILARNGLEAIELQKKHPEISLVLMDIKMPLMDGYDTTRELKVRNHNLPVIATTAYSMANDREKCLAAGCDDYLAKPIKREELLKMLALYLA